MYDSEPQVVGDTLKLFVLTNPPSQDDRFMQVVGARLTKPTVLFNRPLTDTTGRVLSFHQATLNFSDLQVDPRFPGIFWEKLP